MLLKSINRLKLKTKKKTFKFVKKGCINYCILFVSSLDKYICTVYSLFTDFKTGKEN